VPQPAGADLRAQTAIETAQFGGALLLSVALHVPAYLVLTRLQHASPSAPLRIEASVVMGDTRTVQEPQSAPVEPERRAPPTISTQMITTPAPASTAHERRPEPETQDHGASDTHPSDEGVRARILSSLEPEPDTAGSNDFVVAPPVAGDENAPLPFATAPGPGSPAQAVEGSSTPRRDDEERAVSTALTAYGRRLYGRTMAQARYPPEAVARGWQGKVLLLLRFGKSGKLLDVDVRESSGYAVLDTEAVEMAKRAKAESPVPDILRGRDFSLTIAVNFRLEASLLEERGNLPAPKSD